MVKKVVIIGAGPAGLGAASRLAGRADIETIILDQGDFALKRKCPSPNECIKKCSPCAKSSGGGGQGAHADGKFIFESIIGERAVGLNLSEDVGAECERQYLDLAKQFFIPFGLQLAEVNEENLRKAREIAEIASKNDMDYIFARQGHMGTDRLPAFVDKIENSLKDRGVRMSMREKVVSFDGHHVETEKRKISYDHLIIAPGRKGADWLEKQLVKNNLNYGYRAVDIGFRIETDANVLKNLTDVARDVKLEMRIPSHGYLVRTFCVCPHGKVTRETYDFFNLVNGASDSMKASKNTNFALLVSVPLEKVNSNEYGDAIAELFYKTGTTKPVLQQLGDIRAGRRSKAEKMNEWRIQPTLRDVKVGSVGWAMPYDIETILLEGIERLSVPGLMEGLSQESTLVYAPELKRNGLDVKTDPYMRTNIPQISVAGDAAGKSRSIVGAAASGMRAADGIINYSAH